jgi:anti-sigma28 factor (negative regulator of flagellin synthesis)
MLTIQGVGEVTGSKGTKPAVNRGASTGPTESQQTDSVEISKAGSEVASVQYAFQVAVGSEIRQAQVDAAKQRLAEGTYKLQETVLKVASRVYRFIE